MKARKDVEVVGTRKKLGIFSREVNQPNVGIHLVAHPCLARLLSSGLTDANGEIHV